MCYMLYGAVNKEISPPDYQKLSSFTRFTIRPGTKQALGLSIERDEADFRLTTRPCDCDSPFGTGKADAEELIELSGRSMPCGVHETPSASGSAKPGQGPGTNQRKPSTSTTWICRAFWPPQRRTAYIGSTCINATAQEEANDCRVRFQYPIDQRSCVSHHGEILWKRLLSGRDSRRNICS